MDFNDSQQEAAFRKEARDFLEANAEKRSIISDKPNDKNPQIAVAGAPETVKGGKEAAQEALERAKVWQKKKAEAGLLPSYGQKNLVVMVDHRYNKLSIHKKNMITWFLLDILRLELVCLDLL